MAGNSFSKKNIAVSVIMDGGLSRTFSSLATRAKIQKSGGKDPNKATVEIFGLSVDTMAQLTTLAFRPLETLRNKIVISAGDSDLSTVFTGDITSSFADFNTAPDVTFRIEAMEGYYPNLKALPPTAQEGAVPVGNILASLADQAGFTFVNQGVTTSLQNPYLCGSPIEQAQQVAKQAGVDLIIDNGQFIAINPGEARAGSVVSLSAESGLIGYPTFTSEGVKAKCFFLPTLRYGALVNIQSIVPKASGVWRVTKLNHNLSANETGGGPWETEFEAFYNVGQ